MGSWLKTLCYKFIKNVIIVTPPKQLTGPSDWLKTCFYLFIKQKQKQKLKPKQLTGPSDWVRSLLYLFAAEIPVALFLSMAAGAEYKSKNKYKCK